MLVSTLSFSKFIFTKRYWLKFLMESNQFYFTELPNYLSCRKRIFDPFSRANLIFSKTEKLGPFAQNVEIRLNWTNIITKSQRQPTFNLEGVIFEKLNT